MKKDEVHSSCLWSVWMQIYTIKNVNRWSCRSLNRKTYNTHKIPYLYIYHSFFLITFLFKMLTNILKNLLTKPCKRSSCVCARACTCVAFTKKITQNIQLPVCKGLWTPVNNCFKWMKYMSLAMWFWILSLHCILVY